MKIAPRKCREISMIKTSFGVALVPPHRTIPDPAAPAPDRVSARVPALLVASADQVGAPAAVAAGGCAANLNARALLPVAGRW